MIALATINKSHGGFQPPWFTLVSTAVMVVLFILFGAAPETLMFDRRELMNGGVWRLLTGHLVHSDLSHLGWNLGAYLLLGGYLETACKATVRDQLTWFAISGLTVSAVVFVFCPDIYWYVGLSGVLNCFLVIALGKIWQLYRHPITVLVALGVVGKVCLELITVTSLVGAGSWAIVPEAHAAGLIAGGLISASAKRRALKGVKKLYGQGLAKI